MVKVEAVLSTQQGVAWAPLSPVSSLEALERLHGQDAFLRGRGPSRMTEENCSLVEYFKR